MSDDYQRAVHLDFHTSKFIDDVGADFDAEAFAQTIKDSHINSVNLFSKCHHGQCYYPTKTGVQHPALNGRNLLGEQIEALRKHGIRCPLYTTVVWEEDVADRFPEWRQMYKDGKFCQMKGGADYSTDQPGGWRFNNFLHPDYQDYFEAHLLELIDLFQPDGFWIDILFVDKGACWSDESIKFREKHGLMAEDDKTYSRFEALAQQSFMQKFSKIITDKLPKASIFYNGTLKPAIDRVRGLPTRHETMTVLDVESLPSKLWSYYHFPRCARQVMMDGREWVGMTGRFQNMWGDFGGIKPPAALEYECFRTQALGGANSVGDQLPPRGVLDAAAYKLIAGVFEQTAKAEPFYAGSEALPQVGIYLADSIGTDIQAAGGKSEEGAVMMCDECHYDSAVLDETADLSRYDVVMLPDSTWITPEMKKKLETYYKNGGKLILSHKAGRDDKGVWALDFLPLEFEGSETLFPSYWRARSDFDEELSASDRVFYTGGEKVKADGLEVLVDRVLPYFRRTDLKFSSHFQTPPVKDPAQNPAVVAGKGFVYFADPIFNEYRKAGSRSIRLVWQKVMQRLVGEAPFGEGLPTTMQIHPRQRGNDLILTLLHYIPSGKALDIDVIEERMSFAGKVLQLPDGVNEVKLFSSGETISKCGECGGFKLPIKEGRLLIEVPGYFS